MTAIDGLSTEIPRLLGPMHGAFGESRAAGRISIPGRRSLAGSASSTRTFESTSTAPRSQSIAPRHVHKHIVAGVAGEPVPLEHASRRGPAEIQIRVIAAAGLGRPLHLQDDHPKN